MKAKSKATKEKAQILPLDELPDVATIPRELWDAQASFQTAITSKTEKFYVKRPDGEALKAFHDAVDDWESDVNIVEKRVDVEKLFQVYDAAGTVLQRYQDAVDPQQDLQDAQEGKEKAALTRGSKSWQDRSL